MLDVDSAALQPNNLWPKELPRVDGVIICYDASDEASFARVPELLGKAVVVRLPPPELTVSSSRLPQLIHVPHCPRLQSGLTSGG